jgi:hypothetical protein
MAIFYKKIVILGTTSHGLHRRLWAVRGPSAQGRALTGPWATPPTAGAMKIVWGGVKPNNPPWIFVRKNSSSWALTGPWATPPTASAMQTEKTPTAGGRSMQYLIYFN